MPPRKSNADIIAEQVAAQLNAALPNMIAQITAGINQQGNPNPNPNNQNPNQNNRQGCTYKSFMSCRPKEFNGTSGAAGLLTWIESMEAVLHISKCAETEKVEYAACMFQGRALTWWNAEVQTRGREAAYLLTWAELKELLMREYCPRDIKQKLEAEFWNHTMVGTDIDTYTARFHELARLVPHMATPEEKKVDRYIWGLIAEIRGMVTSADPQTTQSAIVLANRLTNDLIREGGLVKKDSGKRKAEGQSSGEGENRFDKKHKSASNFVVKAQGPKAYVGPHPECNKCGYHHVGNCRRCDNCGKFGHYTKYCRTSAADKPQKPACYECGSQEHFIKNCPKAKNKGNHPRGRVFVLGTEEARQDPNTMAGTFILNNNYASVLFDSGADRSFVSLEFRSLVDLGF
jgi:hypothetical protein